MSFIWGTSFILIKKSLLAFTPMQSGALRISFAFLYFLPIAIKRIRNITRKNIKYLLIAGFIGNFFPAFMFAYGETHVSSSIAAMLNSTTPIFVLITGLILFKSKPSWLNIFGLIIGFIGTLGLIVTDLKTPLSGWNIGAIVIIGAAFFYGINTNVLKYKLKDLDGLSIASFSMLFIGPWAIIYFFTSDLQMAYANEYFLASTLSLATLAFFSSFIAIILFVTLIKHTTAIFAASSTYIIPVFAIFWGIIDGDKISIIQIISILIVFAGISLINKKNNSQLAINIK